MIGRRAERGSGISVLAARHDDDDEFNNKNFFALTDQMTISGCFVVNAISVRSMKLCFKLVEMCRFVQPSSNYGLHIFFTMFYFNSHTAI